MKGKVFNMSNKGILEFERRPIMISHSCLALINIYNKNSYIEHTWVNDLNNIIEYMEKKDSKYMFELAAKQFVSQLEGNWCVSFMEALKKEINIHIKEHKEQVKKTIK